MATQGFIGHTDPSGNTARERVTNSGYAWMAIGENLAFGICTAQAAVDGWMKSEGHRENLLYPDFTHTGLGVYRGREPDHQREHHAELLDHRHRRRRRPIDLLGPQSAGRSQLLRTELQLDPEL